MSKWLDDDEVLVGQGSGEASSMSPRLFSLPPGSPRPSRSHSSLSSFKDSVSRSPPGVTMGKARELFLLCDKEGKGFITKRDMQRLQMELPLSPEQLEAVFDSMDRESNGFLTPLEFNTVLGELVGLEDSTELSQEEAEEATDKVEWSQDAAAAGFVDLLIELGADKLLENQQDVCSLWCELQRDRPELLSVLEGVLVHTVSRLQDAIRERDSLEQALCRRENEHDQVVRSIYEDMESQLREEKQKQHAQDSIRKMQRGQKLEEELKLREQELETTLSKQKELETRIRQLTCEQANFRKQNQQLRSINMQLQEQVENSRQQLQTALSQLSLLQLNAAQEQMTRQRNVTRVSKNIQKEKESLLRQLELLRDMNKKLRDEKDAQQTQKRSPNVTKTLQKKGSIIGNYLQQEKPLKRQLSSSDELEQDTAMTSASKRHQSSCSSRCENVEQSQSQSRNQQVFKVVFLGNSGVGKSSFIHYYCTGSSLSKSSATVGIDFQMKTLSLGSTTITLKLWDTAGQERFRSITEQYYRKADGVLAMYDVTHSTSFTAVRGWMEAAKEKMNEGTVLMLLGNKLDLAGKKGKEVTTEEGERLAQHQALFYECSAKTGSNVEELMTQLAEMLVAQHDRQCEDALLLTEETSKKRCCL
ncbi:EF-hand calcium-binding domain-containing protein 4A isoform X2 [Cynoglossus semilaevis]|uniref:EF-hand calcium-binding domain-containing protein 4A isoform X2 n=1 Tax=Cynoglossus semilaevis TaxID=244447 RepID=UPI000D62A023|nr:EF-hand calcium-binding domain-containing protein 4A isoform X2 [Cynoglossus semilaevis]